MGLPRSSLVKSKSSDAPSPTALPMPPVAVLAAPVAVLAAPVPAFAPVPVLPTVEGAPARESFRTKADSVEVQMESQRAPGLASAVPNDVMRAPYASGPSSSELLERAAALGPARMTWESIVLPADPILDEKRLPHVAERRARLTRVVKIALGACVGVCVLALGISAVSGDSSPPSASAATSVSVGKTVASKGIVPVEHLEGTKHAKAVRRTAPVVTTAAIVRGNKRR